MRGKDEFASMNPVVNAVFFVISIGFNMFTFHPFFLGISLISSMIYLIHLRGRKALGFLLKAVLPVVILAAVINPAFNHRGTVILCYLPSGNPLTLESILYGFSAAVLLASALMWFACLTDVFTSDKFIYIAGKALPSLSLLLSMTLRFVPAFTKRIKEVNDAQKALSAVPDSIIGRLKNALNVFSTAVSVSIESSVTTADSMKARGYGLHGRSFYAIYRFTERDIVFLVFYALSAVFLLSGFISGNAKWEYYPQISGVLFERICALMALVYLAVCFSPFILDIKEERVWKLLQSTT